MRPSLAFCAFFLGEMNFETARFSPTAYYYFVIKNYLLLLRAHKARALLWYDTP